MASVELLPSGRFRGFARVRTMREALVFDRREDALRWAEKVEERMRAGKWQAPAKKAVVVSPAETITVAKACADYLASEEFRGKAETTRKAEPSKQKAVIRLLGSKPLVGLTPDDIRDFIKKRRSEPPSRAGKGQTMSSHAVRLELAALSTVCNYAVDRKWLQSNPCRGIHRPKGDRRTRRLTDEEIGQIIGATVSMVTNGDGTPYVFFSLLFSTVCRPGELAGARKEWLRDDPPQICLPRTKNEDARNIVLTVKNHELLRKHLAEQPIDCPYLFGTRKRGGKGWAPYNYRVAWEAALIDAGLQGQGIVPYLARHEGVSRLFERTSMSDGQIAGISGHRSAQALWHYKHLRNEHQRPIMNALDQMIQHAVEQTLAGADTLPKLRPGEMLKPIHDQLRGDTAGSD